MWGSNCQIGAFRGPFCLQLLLFADGEIRILACEGRKGACEVRSVYRMKTIKSKCGGDEQVHRELIRICPCCSLNLTRYILV